MDRRSVLRAAASGAAGALAAGCGSQAENEPGGRIAAPPAATPGSGATARATSSGSPPDQIAHGARDRTQVALTFHGQGEPAVVEPLLAEAERTGARLTVLAVGSWLDAYPRLARRVLDGGHELGNHTQHHLDICAMPADRARAEITDCAERLRKLTGGQGRWFRPSQARYATPLVVRLAQEAGYPHILSYDVDSLDYTDPGADAVRETVLGAVRGGSVVSLHLGHPGTVTALPALLDGLRHRGLRPVTASQLLN
jgi:peptidoglycan/xylan/chitin deacetylase (PgdA/CDA1 family)